jgi:hypothetical protein
MTISRVSIRDYSKAKPSTLILLIRDLILNSLTERCIYNLIVYVLNP